MASLVNSIKSKDDYTNSLKKNRGKHLPKHFTNLHISNKPRKAYYKEIILQKSTPYIYI